jgi:shikimate dehydrogenase
MDRYVVIGNPVSHSLSPAIHAHFAAQMKDDMEYGTLLVTLGRFAPEAQRFFEGGGRGANVTLPFKVDAFEFAGTRSARAEIAGAANFLALRAGTIEADNTDGAGLVADFTRNLGVRVRGASVLIVGAGGAARGVIAPLLAEEPRRLVIANRTLERARDLAKRFAPVEAVAIDAIPAVDFDLVVNATSTSTHGEPLPVPDRVLARAGLAYDMAYGPLAKPFVTRARALGARSCDGLGMLVEQAAESYFLWRGRRPETQAILAELRARQA